MKKFKVLCIDDEPVILDLYEMMLEDHYPVFKACTSDEALLILKNHHQEIIYVLSDFIMPEINGLEFRKVMIDNGFEIPFSMITGNYDLEMASQGMSLRVDSFLSKPIEKEEIIKLIQNQGERRKLQLLDESEMICSFISESYPMLEEIENLILALEKNSRDINVLNTYFRLLHTIKGTASCVGLKSLPKFTHAYEDIVSLAKEQKIVITPKVVDTLLFGLDRLKFMYAQISDEQVFEFNVEEWIATLKDCQNNNDELTNSNGVVDNNHETKAQTEKLSIPLETLDSFLELSGSMTILKNTIHKAISRVELKYTNDKDIEFLSNSIEELHKITGTVQKQITEMRKIGADTITRPLKRVVRDTSKELGKDVELVIHNEHLKIDNTLAKIISNSLVHLVRNSIDHGIERPELREKNGKSKKGTIELSFFEEGDTNIVELRDNGAGIDTKRVLSKALEKNIVSENEVSSLSQNDILSFIFEPGFSTSQNVSSISGRGVGMDMVKTSVESIGGKIKIDSVSGEGTSFTLTLPLPKSVLINKSLMIEEEKGFYSISIEDIVEVVRIEKSMMASSLFYVGGYPVVKRYEELIPVFKLQDCLQLENENVFDLTSAGEIIAIVLKYNETKVGLIVDKVHDIEDSVVRKIKPVLNASVLYSGVTYFGDDDLALVLNVENLAKEKIKLTEMIKNENDKVIDLALNHKKLEYFEYFSFLVGGNQYALMKEKVFRFEILNSEVIQNFKGNYFFKYREGIIKIVGLSSDHLSSMLNQEVVNIILINNSDHLYALYVDEIYEFITSCYPLETHFSKGSMVKGSIIHQEQIVYVVNEESLDQLALSLIKEKLTDCKEAA